MSKFPATDRLMEWVNAISDSGSRREVGYLIGAAQAEARQLGQRETFTPEVKDVIAAAYRVSAVGHADSLLGQALLDLSEALMRLDKAQPDLFLAEARVTRQATPLR